MSVVHQHDEIRKVPSRFGAIAVGHFQPEAVILDVGLDARVGFGHAAELGLPVAIEDHPVDVAPAGVGLPAIRARRVELHVRGGAGGIVRIEHGFDGVGSDHVVGDGGGDAVASHVGQFLIQELSRFGITFAHQTGVEPLLGDALELPEQVEFWVFARIAPLGVISDAWSGGRARWIAACHPGASA